MTQYLDLRKLLPYKGFAVWAHASEPAEARQGTENPRKSDAK
jgi:hypothetical protein